MIKAFNLRHCINNNKNILIPNNNNKCELLRTTDNTSIIS